jgi:peptidyl-prolyl cis-trans isomerase C
MNHKLLAAAMIGLFATVASAETPVAAKAGGQTLATVNGKTIPNVRADALINAQVTQGRKDTEELRKDVREELIRREVIVQAAQHKGLDKKVELQAQMTLAAQGVLISAYINDYFKSNPVTDAMLKSEYDSIRLALGEKEYKARHILVEKEDDAKAIIEKLNKGEKFEDLAKESKDPGSKDRGGDLGWANQAAYVKPFSAAMLKLEKGKFTEVPVKTDFGWHVILLEDSRELKAPGLDEVKPQLTQRLQAQMIEKHVGELRAKAKVQ